MKKLLLILGALALSLGLTTQVHAEDKPKVIRIGYPGAGAAGQPLSSGNVIPTAQQLGSFEKEFQADGIKIEWTFFPGAGPALNEAFSNGKIDFALLGDLPLIVGRSTGLRHKIVAAGGRFQPFYITVPNDSPAQTVADLKGKKWGVFKGTAQQLQLARVLEKFSLTEKEVKVIALDSPTQRQTITTKDIDAALLPPFDLTARGVGKALYQVKNDPAALSVGTIWAAEDFEKKYPQIVQRLVNVVVKTAYWQSEDANRDQTFKIWARDGVTPYGDYLKQYDGVSLKAVSSPILDDYYIARITKAAQEAKKYGLIRRDVNVEGWFDPKYVQNALKELKLENYWNEYDVAGEPKTGKVANAQ